MADQGRAQVYLTERLGEALDDVESLTNPRAHVHQRERVSDRSGRGTNRASGIHQRYDAGPQVRDTARHRFDHGIVASMARHAQLPECAGIVPAADARLWSEIKAA